VTPERKKRERGAKSTKGGNKKKKKSLAFLPCGPEEKKKKTSPSPFKREGGKGVQEKGKPQYGPSPSTSFFPSNTGEGEGKRGDPDLFVFSAFLLRQRGGKGRKRKNEGKERRGICAFISFHSRFHRLHFYQGKKKGKKRKEGPGGGGRNPVYKVVVTGNDRWFVCPTEKEKET